MKKRNYKTEAQTSYMNIIPIIIALSIVPLFVRGKKLEIPANNLVRPTTDVTTFFDLFAYYKGVILIIAALLAIAIYAYNLYCKNITFSKDKYYYLLYCYVGLVIFSFIFSINLNLSLVGYKEHFENVFVLLAYIILFIYTSVSVRTEEELKAILYSWMVAIGIMFIIGLTQYFGHDFFITSIGQALILPSQYGNITINADTDATRNVYQTLYHYNYVSFYAAIILPFFLALSILERNKKMKLLFIGMVIIASINQFISLSRNGFIGIFVALLFVIIFLRKSLCAYKKIFLVLMGVSVIGVTLILLKSDNVMMQRIKQGIADLNTSVDYPLNNIETNKDTVIIDYDNLFIVIKNEPDNIHPKTIFNIYNEKGELYDVNLLSDENIYSISSDNENTILYQYGLFNNNPTCIVTIDNNPWYFTYVDNQFKFINSIGNLYTLSPAEYFRFEGKERFASARGYIWSRSLPLLKQYPLFGSGPDTFALFFPQDDYVAKYNAYGTTNMIIDKPHNIYLGYAINTGIPSLLVLLVLWGIYIVWSFKLYINSSFDTYYSKIGMASMVAIIGYLSSGIFNDTNLNVTPAFWIILGIGFSVNKMHSNLLEGKVKH